MVQDDGELLVNAFECVLVGALVDDVLHLVQETSLQSLVFLFCQFHSEFQLLQRLFMVAVEQHQISQRIDHHGIIDIASDLHR